MNNRKPLSLKFKKIFPNTKADTSSSQIFIYIVSLLIVGSILLFGYKIINDFIGNSSTIEILQFQKNVEAVVRSYTTEYGSQGYKKFTLPGNSKEICVTTYYSGPTTPTDLVSCGVSLPSSPLSSPYKALVDSYGSQPAYREKKNMYLFNTRGELVQSFYAGNITVVGSSTASCNYLCIKPSRGVVELRVIGKGDHVLISSAS